MKTLIKLAALTAALTGASAAYAGPDPSQVYIENFTHNGAGCAPGTTALNISPDRLAMTVIFDSYFVEGGTQSAARREEVLTPCLMNIRMHVPAGWQFAIHQVTYRGFASLDANTWGRQSSTYKWAAMPDFEPLATRDGQDMGSTARRSSGSWTVTTKGQSGHSSGIFAPDVGYGAIYEMARILDQFRSQLPEENLTYNVGLVTGGATAELEDGGLKGVATGKTNIIAGTAIARGDLRALTQDQIDRTHAKMQAIVAKSLPGTGATIAFDPGDYPPMAPTAGNKAILAKLNGVNRDMGLPEMGELPPSDRGAGDISFVAADVDSLAGMGASGGGSHAPGETVDIPSIDKQAKRTAILLTRYSRER